MTLNQLRYFRAVCKYDGVSRAADFINISQPSISNAISELENEFGVILFTRYKKRLHLTKEGLQLLELANSLLEQAENTKSIMHNMSKSKEIRLGIPPMLCSLLIPALYSSSLEYKISIVEADKSGLVQMLNDNSIDMAFLPHDKAIESQYDYELYDEFQNVCCISNKNPLQSKKSIAIEDIKNEPLILFKNSFFQTERILERFRQKDCVPNVFFSSAQVSTVLNVTKSNLAIGFVFDFLIDSSPDVIGIPLNPPMNTKVSLVWRHNKHLSANMIHFINHIRKIKKSS